MSLDSSDDCKENYSTVQALEEKQSRLFVSDITTGCQGLLINTRARILSEAADLKERGKKRPPLSLILQD